MPDAPAFHPGRLKNLRRLLRADPDARRAMDRLRRDADARADRDMVALYDALLSGLNITKARG